MINQNILNIIKQERQKGQFVYPFYGRYSIAEIVPTILSIFGLPTDRPPLPPEFYQAKSEDAKKVVLFFLDGLGYEQLVKYHAKLPFFDRLVRRGEVYPLTSVFPSTTAAALTTISTGLTPEEHGLPEWCVYFEEVDMLIETLPFRPLKQEARDSLLLMGGRPEMLYDAGPTIYEKLRAAKIKSFVFNHEEYAHGVYSTVSGKGAETVPYLSGTDLMVKLRKLLRTVAGPAYFFVYWSSIDAVEHNFGPHTDEHLAELSFFSHLAMAELLHKLDPETAKDTLLIVAADHGQVRVRPEESVYLESYPSVTANFQKGKGGQPITPTGSPRDVFLFIEPPKIDETLTILKRELSSRVEAITIEEAIKSGLFGVGTPTEKFLRRIGNLLILPYRDDTVWYNHVPEMPFKFLGHHGGLSEEEMIVPLAISRLTDLAA